MSFYEFLRSAPYIRLLLPFALGILSGQFIRLPENLILIYYCFLLLFILISLFSNIGKSFQTRWTWGIFFNVTAAFAGLFASIINTSNENLPENRIVATGTIIENPVKKTSSYHIMVRLDAIYDNGRWQASKNKVLCTLQNKEEEKRVQLNQRISLRCYWKEIRNYGNPFEFDYKKYMNRNGIYYRAYIDSDNWHLMGEDPHFKLTIWALKIRNKILSFFRQINLSPSSFAVVSALTVGDKSYLNDDLKKAYVNSGTIHILAVSGMHVALLFWLLQQISRPLMLWRKGKMIRAALVLLVIWVYALITGLTPSVVRASVMFSFWIFGDTDNRNVNIYNTLSASALLLLIINPQTLFDIGFQLSYLAVLGIVVFYKDICNWFFFRSIALKYLWSMIAVSLAAQLFTLPLTLFYFHQFPNYFLLSNIVALPLSTIILYGSLLALIIAPFKILWLPIGWMLKILVDLMNSALLWIEELPYSVTTGISISGLMAISILGIIIAARLFIYNRKAVSVYIILICCIVPSAEVLLKRIKTGRSGDIVVYNAPETLVVQLRNGFENYLINKNNDYNTAKLIKPFNEYYHLNDSKKILDSDAPLINRHLMLYKNFLFFNDKKIYIWEKKPEFNKCVCVDILVIHNIRFSDIQFIEKLIRPKEVIITSGVFRAEAIRLREYFYTNDIPCKVLNVDGAWILGVIKKIDK